jgi:hypothetical protein
VNTVARGLALVVLSLVLAACGGDDKDGGLLGGARAPTESAPTAAATSASPRTTPTPTPTPTAPGIAPRGTVTPASGTSTGRAATPDPKDMESWQIAMMDSSQRLAGEYVSPHPGADGRVCDTKSCTGSMDDRNHVSNTTTIPICTQAQLTARNYSSPLCYHSNPPTSGPHSNNFATNRVHEDSVPKEALVHSMEHSAVIIWYNTNDQQVIRTLTAITNGALNGRKFVVMSRYDGMEANTIALTSWTRLDKFSVSQFNDQRVLDFINTHSRRFNPEGF